MSSSFFCFFLLWCSELSKVEGTWFIHKNLLLCASSPTKWSPAGSWCGGLSLRWCMMMLSLYMADIFRQLLQDECVNSTDYPPLPRDHLDTMGTLYFWMATRLVVVNLKTSVQNRRSLLDKRGFVFKFRRTSSVTLELLGPSQDQV